MGSLIAQELTLGHPEKVNKLILYGSTCGGKQATPPTPAILKDFHIRKSRDTEEYVLCSKYKGSRRFAISKEMDPGKS